MTETRTIYYQTDSNIMCQNILRFKVAFFIGDFERIGVSLIAALRAAAQPQFSQSHLGKSLFKTYKILTYNALVKVAITKR